MSMYFVRGGTKTVATSAFHVPQLQSFVDLASKLKLVYTIQLENSWITHRPTFFPCIARTASDLLKLASVEALSYEQSARVGRLYGYPSCCVRAFQHRHGGVPEQMVKELYHRKYSVMMEKLFFVEHIPCSWSCPSSIRLGEQNMKILSAMNDWETIFDLVKSSVLYITIPHRIDLRRLSELDALLEVSPKLLGGS